jgi:hypothetical protein
MRLCLLHEFYSVVGGYPGNIVKGKKKRGKNDLRFVTNPESADRVKKWISGKTKK